MVRPKKNTEGRNATKPNVVGVRLENDTLERLDALGEALAAEQSKLPSGLPAEPLERSALLRQLVMRSLLQLEEAYGPEMMASARDIARKRSAVRDATAERDALRVRVDEIAARPVEPAAVAAKPAAPPPQKSAAPPQKKKSARRGAR